MSEELIDVKRLLNELEEKVERIEELELEIRSKSLLLRSAISELKHCREALNSVVALWVASTEAADGRQLAHVMSEVARKALEGEFDE